MLSAKLRNISLFFENIYNHLVDYGLFQLILNKKAIIIK